MMCRAWALGVAGAFNRVYRVRLVIFTGGYVIKLFPYGVSCERQKNNYETPSAVVSAHKLLISMKIVS